MGFKVEFVVVEFNVVDFVVMIFDESGCFYVVEMFDYLECDKDVVGCV